MRINGATANYGEIASSADDEWDRRYREMEEQEEEFEEGDE